MGKQATSKFKKPSPLKRVQNLSCDHQFHMHENKKNHFHLNGFTFSLPWSNSEMAYYETLVNKRVKGRKPRKRTLGARDFSSAVSGFCQVFIVTRAKSFSRGFGLQPKMCRPSARKTSGTQGKENEAETENARHGRREIWTPTLSRPPTPSQCTIVYAKKQFHLFYITYDVLYLESTFSGLKLRNYLASYLIKCYCQSIKLFGQHS